MVEIDLIKKKIQSIEGRDVLAIKDDLILLYKSEIFERNLYFQEMRRFDGEELETIKWLSVQEETHANAIEMILSRADVVLAEPVTSVPKLSTDKKELIQFDLDTENKAVENYSKTISKSTGALREILTSLMQEELKHISRLRDYL